MSHARSPRDWARWATAASLSVVGVATGCASPERGLLPTQGTLLAGEAGHPAFPVSRQGNQLVCGGCGTPLGSDGRHRIGAFLVRNLQYMRSREAFTRVASPSQARLKDVLIEAIAKIGPSKLGFRLPDEAPLAVGVDRVNQFPDPCPTDQCWRDYVKRHPQGCCIPDGVAAPDAPY
ncbi:MAG: hypothetical protein VKP62_06230 [Candidatus Sericytochromatia bacterium]|nr:hypothetical protein [Candidatus Sericytochromatia bacterium]